MPNLRKKPQEPSAGASASAASGLSRLVSGLRHEGGSSSLVVQTGFPTSLADLVVKNCDRLKKTYHQKKRSSDLDSSAADVAAASPKSEFGPPHSPRGDRRCRRLHPPESGAPRGADCVHRLASPAAGPTKRIGVGFLLGLFLVNLLVLAVPTTGRRKFAAGITFSALGLWLLDTIGVRLFGFLQTSDNATRSLELVPGGMCLERMALVSQIREIGTEKLLSPTIDVGNGNGNGNGRVSCSFAASERSKSSSGSTEASEQSMIYSNLIGTSELSRSCPALLMRSNNRVMDSVNVSFKRRDLGALAKVCVSRVASSSSNPKAKKLFWKFLQKKFRRKMSSNDANGVALDLGCREISNSIIEHEEEAMEDDQIAENNVEGVIRFIASDSVSTCDVQNMNATSFIASGSVNTCDTKNMVVVQQRVSGAKYISYQLLACFAFILLGLLEGKTMALVLFVFCFLLVKSIEFLRKKKMDSVVDKLYNT